MNRNASGQLMEREVNYRARFILLGLAFVLAFFISFLLGRYPVTPVELFKMLLSRFLPITRTWSDGAETAVFQVRLPRILAAGLIGAGLSAAGAAYQGTFQNPMVSPDILGASSGAGFGAALGILLSFSYAAVSIAAFAFGLGAVLLAYVISRAAKGSPTLAMILTGMMISSLFNSATSFVKLMADTDNVLPVITYWLMGSLASVRMEDVWFILGPMALGLGVLFVLRWRINLLTVGEEEAKAIGVNTGRLRALVVVAATLLTAAAVSVSGLIGWVGLVIPHFCRMWFGDDYRRVIPASMLLGATFLMIVDNVARLAATSEIPLGILTSFVGAPLFFYLILTGGNQREA